MKQINCCKIDDYCDILCVILSGIAQFDMFPFVEVLVVVVAAAAVLPGSAQCSLATGSVLDTWSYGLDQGFSNCGGHLVLFSTHF